MKRLAILLLLAPASAIFAREAAIPAGAIDGPAAFTEKCAMCQERREMRLEPSKLFAAVPLVVAPMLLKMKVAHALSGSGVPMEGSDTFATEESPHGRRRRRGRHVATAAVVIVGAFTGVGLAAKDVGELHLVETAIKQGTTTTLATTTTTTVVTAPPVTNVTATTKPHVGIPFVPPPTTPPTAPATASISVVPASEPNGYTIGRVMAKWSTSGGASVQVTGPEGLISTAPTGSAAVCPGTPRSGTCNVMDPLPHTYTYTVTVRDGSGVVVAQQSATLTIT